MTDAMEALKAAEEYIRTTPAACDLRGTVALVDKLRAVIWAEERERWQSHGDVEVAYRADIPGYLGRFVIYGQGATPEHAERATLDAVRLMAKHHPAVAPLREAALEAALAWRENFLTDPDGSSEALERLERALAALELAGHAADASARNRRTGDCSDWHCPCVDCHARGPT